MSEPYLEAAGQLVLFDRVRWRPERFAYVEVAGRRVRHRVVAEAVRRWASKDLGIRPPRMRFFVPLALAPKYAARTLAFCSDGVLLGLACHEEAEIWINASQARREMAAAVAHEVKQMAQGTTAPELTDRREDEARHYRRQVGRGAVARRAGRGRRPDWRWQRAQQHAAGESRVGRKRGTGQRRG